PPARSSWTQVSLPGTGSPQDRADSGDGATEPGSALRPSTGSGSPIQTPDTVAEVASGTETPERESFRSVLTWPVVAAATVLALMAAGIVLWIGSSDDDDGPDDTIRLSDPVEVGDPLDVELTLPDGESTTSLRQLL